ncbi:MAG: hypothetical protein KC912_09800 [Proteobacteria bacterium]|nr:hypothetical protein [Pseudomonadota bacterium]
MKNVLIAAAALVIGLLIGSVVPSSKIRGLEAEIEELQRQTRSSRAQDLARFFQQGADIAKNADDDELLKDVARDLDDEIPDVDESRWERRRRERREHRREMFEEADGLGAEDGEGIEVMREAMELRRTQAREALKQAANADEEQLAAIDGAMGQMNDQLRDLAQRMVDDVVEYGEPDRRGTMEFAAEGLDIVLAADTAVRGALTEEQLWDVDDAAVDPFSYVDPSILDVFENIELPPPPPEE